MTDRELLELAAKAAGIETRPGSPWAGYNSAKGFYRLCGDGSSVTWRWNPLTDDGDALRLAVKLGLDVMTCCQQRGEIQIGGAVSRTTFQPVNYDPFVATRHAIVRAAAEIGRAMP